MPMITTEQLEKMSAAVESARAKIKKVQAVAEERAGMVKDLAETAFGGAVAGYVSGRFGDAAGNVTLLGFSFNPGLALGAATGLSAMLDIFGEYNRDALNVAGGLVGGYAAIQMKDVGTRAKAKGNWMGDGPELIGAAQAAIGAGGYDMRAPADDFARAMAGR